MLAVDPGLLTALRRSALTLKVMAEVWDAGRKVATFQQIDGTVTVDTGRDWRREVQLTFPATYATGLYEEARTSPETPFGLLSPYGQEVRVWWQAAGWEALPLGRFRIQDAGGSLMALTETTLVGRSFETYPAEDQFTSARTLSGPSHTSLITSLILETLPSAEVAVIGGRDARVPQFTTDEDRWGTIKKLATAIGAVVYCDAWGRFVIADMPSVDGDPEWFFDDETLNAASTSMSRDGIVNAWVVRGQSPGGDFAPMQGVRRDAGATSPTRWGDPDVGAFGKVTGFKDFETITTLEQAYQVGDALLARSTGAAEQIDIDDAVPLVMMDGGECVIVAAHGARPRKHVIDSFQIPLTPGGQISARTRAIQLDVDAVTP